MTPTDLAAQSLQRARSAQAVAAALSREARIMASFVGTPRLDVDAFGAGLDAGYGVAAWGLQRSAAWAHKDAARAMRWAEQDKAATR